MDNEPVNGISAANSSTPRVYLDYASTTPCDPRVVEKMMPYFTQNFGNPHARNHAYGWEAAEAVNISRINVADLLNVDEREIFFTSGATEANVLAIRGLMMHYSSQHNPFFTHMITTQAEHKSVLSCCKQLEKEGIAVTYLPVNTEGLVNVRELEMNLRPQTALVSIAAVNNETGVIQPMHDIGACCFANNVILHTDATQALGKIPVDLVQWNVGMASFSAHKIYGPKGIGALYIRRKPSIKLCSILAGGGQQQGVRGGTSPVPLCVGFGEACRLLCNDAERQEEWGRIARLSRRLYEGLSVIPLAHLNGGKYDRVPHIMNMSFPYIEGESLAMSLQNVCVSTGSACSSDKLEPSYVLKAMHADDLTIQSSIRFSLGRYTTEQDIDITIKKTIEAVRKLRNLSPLWEMFKGGVDFRTIRWK